MSFSKLRKSASDLETLRAHVQEKSGQGNREDAFVPGVDPSNNGHVRARLLPAEDGINHFVSYIRFNFKRGAKVYNNLSRRTIGENDPCQDFKNALYNAGDESRKNINRKNVNVCYIYVYEDKVNPDNNGKVFMYYAPMAIKDLIENAINPKEDKFADEQPKPFNPFDIFGDTGRDLIIKVTDNKGQRNYEKSYFVEKPSAWFDDEDQMDKTWSENVKPLADIIAPEKFKSYDELKEQLIDVIGKDHPVIQQVFFDGDEVVATKSSEAPTREKEQSEDVKSETKSSDNDESVIDTDEEFDF